MNQPVIAIDLGGTAIKAAIVSGEKILSSSSIPANSSEGLGPQLPRIAEQVRSLCGESGIQPSVCAGLGMAVPFLVDPVASKVTSAPKEKYFDACDLDLPAWSEETLGIPLKIENDAHAACLGEWRYGAGRGVDDLVMFTLGTGIGCSAILRGHPVRGKRFQAGVLGGHMVSDPDGEPCVCCPANGCFESLSASRSLPGHARSHPAFAASPLSTLEEIDFKAVFECAQAGDATAVAVRDKVIRYWSALAINVCAAYDPDVIIIGGAVSAASETFLPPMREYVNRHAWTVRPPDILPAALGNHAGTVGIASLFTHQTVTI